MAETKSTYACLFVLMLIFSHSILSSEGRKLKEETRNESKAAEKSSNPRGGTTQSSSKEAETVQGSKTVKPHGSNPKPSSSADDLKPTGHSPGVGHSLEVPRD
ncbi:hypothetical protein ACLOJK_013646 [Asimina triloba]